MINYFEIFCQWLCYTFPIFTCNYHLYMQLNTGVDVYFYLHALSSLSIKHKVQHLLFERCSYKSWNCSEIENSNKLSQILENSFYALYLWEWITNIKMIKKKSSLFLINRCLDNIQKADLESINLKNSQSFTTWFVYEVTRPLVEIASGCVSISVTRQ